MRHFESDVTNEFSVLSQELKLLKDRIDFLEASVFKSPRNPVLSGPVGHEQALLGTVDVHDAHITVQSQQGAIAIAIRSPSKASTYTSTATTPSHDSVSSGSRSDATAIFPGNLSPSPTPTPTAPPPTPVLTGPTLTPIPFIPSETIIPSETTLSWGLMMTPDEVRDLLAPQPQIGEYYVVTKGRRPGVYLSWADAHELVDGLRSPCHWKKADKYAALGQYTMAYKKGTCEYRFQ